MKVLSRSKLQYMVRETMGFVWNFLRLKLRIISGKSGGWASYVIGFKKLLQNSFLKVEFYGLRSKESHLNFGLKIPLKKLLLSEERFLTEDQEEDGFYTKRLCIYSKLGNNIYENFKVIFRGKVFVLRAKEIPGWVPEFADEFDDDDESERVYEGDTANNSHGAFNLK
ncbi:hypothetical protein Tco_0909220 [Tanacetum coccineum]|uniref:Uncharacterized protein n=1 Tax=Tanacetum coccineum TaxID=301880 RepID=A0ABQ5CQL4_9ASTR